MGNIVMFPTHKARKPKVKVNKQTEESLSLKFKDLISFTSKDDTEK